MITYNLLPHIELVKLLNSGDYDAFFEIRRRLKHSLFTIVQNRISDLEASTIIVEIIFEEIWNVNVRNEITTVEELDTFLATTIKDLVVKHFLIKNGAIEHKHSLKGLIIGLGAFLDQNTKEKVEQLNAEIGSIHKEVVQTRTPLS